MVKKKLMAFSVGCLLVPSVSAESIVLNGRVYQQTHHRHAADGGVDCLPYYVIFCCVFHVHLFF